MKQITIESLFITGELTESYSYEEIRNRVCDRLENVEDIEDALFAVDYFLFSTPHEQRTYICNENGLECTEAYEILGFDNVDQYRNWLCEHIA